MPNATDQPTDGSRRGTVFVLVLAAAVATGLWFYLDRPEAPTSTERPGPTESATDAAPATDATRTAETGAARTADSGTTSSEVASRTTDADTADSDDTTHTVDADAAIEVEEPGTTETESGTPADIAQTTEVGAAAEEEVARTADTGSETPTDIALSTDDGAVTQGDAPSTADPGSETPTNVTRTTDDDAAARAEERGTATADAEPPTDIALSTDDGAAVEGEAPSITGPAGTIQPTDPGTPGVSESRQAAGTGSADPSSDASRTPDPALTDEAQQLAAVEPTAALAKDDLVLAAAPEETVEMAPIDAQTVEETTGATGILATVESAVEGAIERIESAIQERLSSSDADTGLRVQVTYDDSQEDAAQEDVAQEDGAQEEVAQQDGGSSVAAQTTESGASTPADDAPTPDSEVRTGPDIAELTGSDDVTARTTGVDASTPADDAPAPDSEVDAGTHIAKLTDSDGAAPSDVTQPAATASAETDTEARKFVEALTDAAPETIAVDRADHFVTQERVISLVPEDTIESVSVEELARDESLTLDTPITVVREVEQIEPAVPEQLIAESGGDLDKQLRVRVTYDDSQDATDQGGSGRVAVEEDVVEQVAVREAQERIRTESDDSQDTTDQGSSGSVAVEETVVEETTVREALERIRTESDDSQDTTDQGGSGSVAVEETVVEEITVREALERIRTEPERQLTVIKKVRYFEVMTLRELLDTVADSDTFLNVVTRPYRIESATLADILRQHKAENPDSIFYLHTVQPTDEQGIWGIVHFGLIDNFARGMAIRHGKDIETYTVRIPRDADERLEDQSSSFLGKLIDRKTKDSYVYNFREHRMGRNPDRIYPGQELVIINFEPEELISIYRHFDSG